MDGKVCPQSQSRRFMKFALRPILGVFRHFKLTIPRSRVFSVKQFENNDFASTSERSLNALLERLESKENVLPSTFDAEYSQGVLTIKFDPQTIYVLNKQPPNQQIWLSSPFSGPRRFEWSGADGTWRDVRNSQIELNEFLRREFEEHLKLNL